VAHGTAKPQGDDPVKRIELYSAFERLWHWLQAIAIVGLLVTGVEIHWPAALGLLGFERATRVHELLALITVANAFLSLFYHLATGAIGEFIPEPRDFFSLAVAQARYYLFGIFRGAPHPFQRRTGRKLNVLQQVVYLGTLNVLLPLQVMTGVLIWKAPSSAALVESLGGLRRIAAVHTLGAWLFGAFLVAHVYLTTTGPTPLAYVRAMLVGWEPADEPRTLEPNGTEGGPS
jgi:thiosulfate reductase cytochrome b subunit